MNKNTKLFRIGCLLLSISWLVVGGYVLYGLYLTNNPKCLWALVIPLLLGRPSLSTSSKEEEEETF